MSVPFNLKSAAVVGWKTSFSKVPNSPLDHDPDVLIGAGFHGFAVDLRILVLLLAVFIDQVVAQRVNGVPVGLPRLTLVARHQLLAHEIGQLLVELESRFTSMLDELVAGAGDVVDLRGGVRIGVDLGLVVFTGRRRGSPVGGHLGGLVVIRSRTG